jgi:hypothetical protein
MLGRAGLIAALAAHQPDDPALARHLDRLSLHAVPHNGTIAFPGHQLLRLSMDLHTGGAGILLALHAAKHRMSTLPFLRASTPVRAN